MKRIINTENVIFGMSDLNPRKTGLKVIIWADHSGINRQVSHSNTPRVKIGKNFESFVTVSIKDEPKIVGKSKGLKKSDMDAIQEGMKYVSRNRDLFLKHFQDTDGSYDDEDLYNDLRSRGDYK